MASYVKKAGKQSLRRIREEPLWLKILKQVYHKGVWLRYGLKHVVLVLILLLYALFGAVLFVVVEVPAQTVVKTDWQQRLLVPLQVNRSEFVGHMMRGLFNNTNYLVYLPHRTSLRIRQHMHESMRDYEASLGIKYTEQKIEWDFWNAILYCGTIFTTIGYGHIYPRTSAGRIITMVYSIGGIPLLLVVLQDLGRLLTVGLKFPWFQFKRGFRRCLRYLTKQSWEEMIEIENKEREELEVFDLPVPVAIVIVVGWIFLCSTTFCIWENHWSYLEAFYFFFISLSTVGLGDLTPENPRLLLMMFGYIIVGLSLVSMVINLIQMKLERTYQVGALEAVALDLLSDGLTTTGSEEVGPPGWGSGGVRPASLIEGRVASTLGKVEVGRVGDGLAGGVRDKRRAALQMGLFQSIPSLTDTILMGPAYRGLVLAGSLTPRRVHRATQTTFCFPAMRELVQSDGGVVRRSESADDITQLLLLSDAEARVLGDVGELYGEESAEMRVPYGSPESPHPPPTPLTPSRP